MLTHCPNCATFFRVSNADLAAADGEVRCSKCDTVFDARAHMHDDEIAGGTAAALPPPKAADLRNPSIGDLFGDPPDAALAASARPQGRDDQALAEGALAAAVDAAVDAAEAGPLSPDHTLPDLHHAFHTLRDAGRPREKYGRWVIASAVLGMALIGQLVHANRDHLARDPAVGTLVVDTYETLRLPIVAPTDLGALAIARTEVTSHPLYDGVLYITATVTNDASFPQPLPLLRVRLDDRWGEPLGTRMFTPAEYLRTAPPPGARAEPGRSYAIALEVLDPGNDAVGYALSPCLAMGSAIVCSGDDPGAR